MSCRRGTPVSSKCTGVTHVFMSTLFFRMRQGHLGPARLLPKRLLEGPHCPPRQGNTDDFVRCSLTWAFGEEGEEVFFFFFFTLGTVSRRSLSLQLNDTRCYFSKVPTLCLFPPICEPRSVAAPKKMDQSSSHSLGIQGYLTHKGQSPPLGPPCGPVQSPTVVF